MALPPKQIWFLDIIEESLVPAELVLGSLQFGFSFPPTTISWATRYLAEYGNVDWVGEAAKRAA
jgi:hypothetical protein